MSPTTSGRSTTSSSADPILCVLERWVTLGDRHDDLLRVANPRRRRLDHSGTKALSKARPLRSALSRSRRRLDDLRGLPRMRQERDVTRRDLVRRRADPLCVEPLELRADCPGL